MAKRKKVQRPKILVLEALSGASGAVKAAGGVPVTVNPKRLNDKLLDALDGEWHGLLLTGGGDVDPRMYTKKPHPTVYGVSQTRDDVDCYALQQARDRDVPVFGICRGEQLMNVEAGGTLRQHINGHRGGRHLVFSEPGTVFRSATRLKQMMPISLHHQAVQNVADGFIVTGTSRTGTAEAIESKDGRCLGVQFHPEMDDDAPYARALFRWLVAESARRAGMEVPKPPRQRRKPAYTPYGDDDDEFGYGGWGGYGGWKRQGNLLLPERSGTTTKPVTFICQVCNGEYRSGQLEVHLKTKRHRDAWKRRNGRSGATRPPKKLTRDQLEAQGVVQSWYCPLCNVPRFDNQQDRIDHIAFVHGEGALATMIERAQGGG